MLKVEDWSFLLFILCTYLFVGWSLWFHFCIALSPMEQQITRIMKFWIGAGYWTWIFTFWLGDSDCSYNRIEDIGIECYCSIIRDSRCLLWALQISTWSKCLCICHVMSSLRLWSLKVISLPQNTIILLQANIFCVCVQLVMFWNSEIPYISYVFKLIMSYFYLIANGRKGAACINLYIFISRDFWVCTVWNWIVLFLFILLI